MRKYSKSELNILEAIELICMRLQTEDPKEVSNESGVTKPTVIRWRDQGVKRPGLYTFVQLADYCGVKVTIRDLKVAARKKILSIVG